MLLTDLLDLIGVSSVPAGGTDLLIFIILSAFAFFLSMSVISLIGSIFKRG